MAAEFDNSLYDHDAGYYEYIPGMWLPGKLVPGCRMGTWSRSAVDAGLNVDLDDSDVIIGTYLKTGKYTPTITMWLLGKMCLK